MKTIALLLAAVLFAGCTSAPTPATTTQQTIANAVTDALSVGLVPVLSKNSSYVPAAKVIAAGLGTFSGSTITPADVDALLGKTTLADADKKVVAGVVNAAWGVYIRRYQQQIGANLRPDVSLFLRAVSDGIIAACAAVPPTG